MNRIKLLLLLLATMPAAVIAQRIQQPLGRGVVVTYRSGGRSVTSSAGTGYLASWRKLAQEPEGTTYNLYRRTAGTTDYTKVNSAPLKNTNYKLSSAANNTEYAVTAITPDGVEGPMSSPFLYKTQPWPNVWFKFDFDNTVIPRNDYRTKFVWPMDLDGDGEVDAVVCDRLFAGAANNDDAENQSDNTATTTHKLQAYRLDGTLLWTVDMGPNLNICGGQNDMVLAYDINCDGRCEVIIKSSDGTRFWDKQNETWGRYAMGSDVADVDGDGVVDYRTHATRVPPFYVSVIDGATGAELTASELKYSEANDGSDQYGRNARARYMSFGYAAMDGHFCICYLDGIHPSLVMECLDRDNNKTHHNYVFTWDYDWTSGQPINWHHSSTWSRNDKSPWPAEFHQLRVGDVNGDGCDEMLQGGYSVNPLKGWFQSPGIGHGDRYIISDIDPDRPGMEAYAIQQSALLGQLLYDPATGERIKEWYLPSVYDVGRGACMDIDPTHKGYEIYSFTDDFIYDCKGDKTSYTRSGCGITTMFEGVWWDGDLLREELSSPGGSGWGTNLMITKVLNKARLVEFSQESSWATHGATGTRPAFMGDVTGDWREEIILANQNADGCTGLVGYTTHIPSDYSIYCLQQDPHYRLDCTTRGYYQHPNTSFYLGTDMPMPPLPPVFEADLRWRGGASLEQGFSLFDMTATAPYAEGKSLMFDLSGDNSQAIKVSQPLNAPVIYLMNPKGHDYELQSTHFGTSNAFVTTGTGQLIKSMLGTTRMAGHLGHTGNTIISEGTLSVSGDIAGPVELRAKGTLSGSVTLHDTITFEGALNYEGCRLMPGNGEEPEGVIESKKSMTLPGGVYIEVTAGFIGNSEGTWPVCSSIKVEGDLTFRNTNYITVNLQSKDAADYVIAECTGTLTCDVSKLQTRGLEGINYDLVTDGQKLILHINDTRSAATDVVWTGSESGVWDYKTQNFSLDSNATAFVPGDAVVFDADGANTTITLSESMPTSGVTFNGGSYTFNGNGGISGTGDVTVNGGANVTFNLKNSDYTGRTIVNQSGTLVVPNFYDGGQKSAIGASTAADGNLQLNGGTLVLSRDNMATDHIINVTDTATIRIAQANSSLSMKGQVKGTGYLVKDGAGQLNFTYGGANNFAGVIVRQGIISQGAWNSTFGRSGSPMLLQGGEVHQIDVNSTSTVPTLNHVFTVAEGTTNKIVGSSRGKINGSFHGTGKLTIQTRYVRCDVGASFADFEGELTATGAGGNFRLMQNVTDMSKTRLMVSAGTYVAHYASGGSSEVAATLKIGSLSSPAAATDAVLGGQSTYHVGGLNENTSFYGLFKAASIVKEGTGKLTLRTTGHTSPMRVTGGTLELLNSTSTAITSGLITVAKGGTLTGNALTANVTVANGGTVTGGINNSVGTLRIGGNLTLAAGSTLLCQLSATNNSKLNVSGTVRHNGDTILVRIPATRTLEVGDEITVFTSGTQTGSFVVKVEAEDTTYEFDSSTLLTDGKLRVASVSAIAPVLQGNALVDVYSADGMKLRAAVPAARALDGLPAGMYIVGGRKVLH